MSVRMVTVEAERRYLAHISKWKGCSRCALGVGAYHTVLGRGVLPCNFLIIGEAPGASEDMLGKPFCGPAGKLLNYWLVSSGIAGDCFITNLVACKPPKNRLPLQLEVATCNNRLLELIQITEHRGLIFLGRSAVELCSNRVRYYCHDVLGMLHPAALLHRGLGKTSKQSKRAIYTLKVFARKVKG